MPVPYLGDFINGLIIIALLIFAILFFITFRNTGSLKSSAIIWGIILGVPFLFFQGRILYSDYGRAQENKKYQEKQTAFLAKSVPYFEAKCKSAGIFIYDKNIPSQESVYIMRPFSIKERLSLPQKNGNNWQYIEHDFFNHKLNWQSVGYSGGIDKKFENLASQKNNIGFSYIETYLDAPSNLVRFEYVPDPREGRSGDKVFEHIPINKITSRYGVTWQDISTKEDRDHWVAGGKRQIIDMKTGKVVAEAIGYVLAERPFNEYPNTPWDYTKTCPDPYMAGKFVWSVLRNKEYLESEQNLTVDKGK